MALEERAVRFRELGSSCWRRCRGRRVARGGRGEKARTEEACGEDFWRGGAREEGRSEEARGVAYGGEVVQLATGADEPRRRGRTGFK